MNPRIPAEEWNRQRAENTRLVREAVETLENRVSDEAFDKIWLAVKETRELFKLRPLERDEQQDLWRRLNQCCDRLKTIERENVEEVESALHRLKDEHHLSWLDEMSIDANRFMGFDQLFNMDFSRDFGAIWSAANEVGNLLHSKTLLPRDDRNRLRDQLNGYRTKLREIQDLHRDRYERDCEMNRGQINNQLLTLEDLVGERGFNEKRREIADMLKNLKPLRRDDRNTLWDRFKDLCREDTENQIERLRERRNKQEEFLDRKKSQRDDLQAKLYEARSGSDYEDRVRGWLQECEDKIDEVQTSIDEIDDRIQRLKDRL